MKKNVKYAVMSLLMLSPWTAQAASAPRVRVVDAADQVNALLGVTKNSVDRLVRQVKDANAVPDGADYAAKKEAMLARIAVATNVFEAWLTDSETGLAARLQPLMERYQHFQMSNQFPQEEKLEILAALRKQIEGLALQMTDQYQGAIRELEAGAGFDLYGHASDWESLRGAAYQFASEGCLSQTCVIESATDEIVFLSEVERLFNHEMKFRLSDGSRIVIQADDGDVQAGQHPGTGQSCRYYQASIGGEAMWRGYRDNQGKCYIADEISEQDYRKFLKQYEDNTVKYLRENPASYHGDMDAGLGLAYFRCAKPSITCDMVPTIKTHKTFLAETRKLFSDVNLFPSSFTSLPPFSPKNGISPQSQ